MSNSSNSKGESGNTSGRAPRAEFPKAIRRAALLRSGGFCEAVGRVYGLAGAQRCNAPLSKGVEFDHYPVRAADGGDNSLENCVAVCPTCHKTKTSRFDIPQSAKSKRIRDRHTGVVGIRDRSHRSFATNRNGPFKRRLDGTIVPRG